MVEDGVMLGWFGVIDIEPQPAQLPVLQGFVGGVEVDQRATAAVDQYAAGPQQCESVGVDQVVVLRRQRHVERDEIACRQKLFHTFAAVFGGNVDVGIVRADPHVECLGDARRSAADAPETDDAQRGAVEITDRDGAALVPPAFAHQRGQRGEPLDRGQQMREDTFGNGTGVRTGCDDHRYATASGFGHSTRSVPTPVRARTFSAGIRSSMALSTVNAARTIAASATASSSSLGFNTSR